MRCAMVIALLMVTVSFAQTPRRLDKGQQPALAQARDRWHTANLSSYSFVVRRVCFCFLPDVKVIVQGNRVISATEQPSGRKASRAASLSQDKWDEYWVMTVPEMFKKTDSFLRNPQYRIKVSYDARLGYPAYVHYQEEPPPPAVAGTDSFDGMMLTEFLEIR